MSKNPGEILSNHQVLNDLFDGRFQNQVDISFLSEHVRTVRIGRVNLVIIDQEHPQMVESLNPNLEAIISDPKTKAVITEYFEPELHQNALKVPLFGKAAKKAFDVIYPLTQKQTPAVEQACKKYQKPIAVCDIANKPEYMFDYTYVGIAANLPVWLVNRFHEFTGGGQFDPEKIHVYEKFLADTEDARRVFVAKGAEMLANEFQPADDKPLAQIVLIYPKAHALRIANYLANPEELTQSLKTAKEAVYRLLPGLDFKVRVWEWKDMMSKALDRPSIAHWEKVANETIR